MKCYEGKRRQRKEIKYVSGGFIDGVVREGLIWADLIEERERVTWETRQE